MCSMVLLVALGGVPAQVFVPLHYREGGIPRGPAANGYFSLSMNQSSGDAVVLPAAETGNTIRGPAPARLLVRLPADARLTIDGAPTRSTGDTRSFASPPLPPGRGYVYVLQAEAVRDGKKIAETRKVLVRAGEESEVTLTFPQARVAGK